NEKITGISEYTYDALYRLIGASGRENNSTLDFGNFDNWNDKAFLKEMNPGDPMALRNFTQSYDYDPVGNIKEMKHRASGGNWTRTYVYETDNNRLKSTHIGDNSNPFNYKHHEKHGYLEELPHLEKIGWNFKEEVVKTIRQKRNDGGTPETTYYQYDGSGQRIRKITENQAHAGAEPTKKEERIYVSGYELYKKHSGTDAGLERVSLSLMDEEHRFVMIETRNEVDDGTEKQLVRYQLHNHLGSAALELDDQANVISYEEYHPFGTTAYQAKNKTIKAAAKRYRYTGMERDEETGLEYHSARYYLPWLGRWLSADPIGIGDGVNGYGYSQNSPVNLKDTGGKQSHTAIEIGSMVQTAVDLGSTGREQLMENVSRRVGIDDLSQAWKMFQGSELKIYNDFISPLSQNFNRSVGASQNLNRLNDISLSVPVNLVIATSYREGYGSSIYTQSDEKIHTWHEGGLDFLWKNKDRIPLPEKIKDQWEEVPSFISGETGKEVSPAWIPKRDAILGYAAQTQLSFEIFSQNVRNELGEDAGNEALEKLSEEAKLVWQAHAFIVPGGKEYEEGANYKSWGATTTLQYLGAKAKKEGAEVDLNEILTDERLGRLVRIKSAKTRAAEALFLEELFKIAEEKEENLIEYQEYLILQLNARIA
ncbi:MAG TPA: RHS repeat-associated core domain-containing protein, partial [Flavobacteriaceae bacterium]|nr:RHS repeat-associated core domain-containing protein [Flavobacteriaceae bacterium]